MIPNHTQLLFKPSTRAGDDMIGSLSSLAVRPPWSSVCPEHGVKACVLT